MIIFGNGRDNQIKFSDAQLLDPQFPDVRMNPQEHREQRHRYYRQQVFEQKRKTALTLYSEGWVGILYRLWTGKTLS